MNNCSLKSLIKTIALFLVLILPNFSHAYAPKTTHAGLTEQLVEFYNLNFSQKITDGQKELMIKGSIDEDSPASRALNHFYDPIDNTGIEGSRTSKEWATNGDLEANEFSWPKAIKYYAEGNGAKAFLSLGYVLHLFEDAGVPDHTRADAHMKDAITGESVYEKWADDNKNRETLRGTASGFYSNGLQPKILSGIGEYFDFMAEYSNGNFFSPDTVKSDKYISPNIEYFSDAYGYGNDSIDGDRYLIIKKIELGNGNERLVIFDEDNNDFSILSSYFDRLSKQIIISGAGLVDLFLREAKIAREKYLAGQKHKQEETLKKEIEIGKQISSSGIFGKIAIGFKILIDEKVENIILSGQKVADLIFHNTRGLSQETENYVSMTGTVSKDLTIATQKAGGEFVNNVDRETSGAALGTLADLVIKYSETSNSGDDEMNLDISREEAEKMIAILKSTAITDSVKEMPKISFLFGGGGFSSQNQPLIQEIVIIPEVETPPSTILVTPLSTTTEEIIATTTEETVATSTETMATSSEMIIETTPVAINEVAWTGEASGSDQWVELYNNTDSDIELSSWRLYSTSSSFGISLSGIIKSHDYFLIEDEDDLSSSTESLAISDTSVNLKTSFGEGLSKFGENLILSHTVIRASSTEEIISDEIPFCENWCNKGKRNEEGNFTMERFDSTLSANNWENWGTNLRIIKNGKDKTGENIFGTPRKRNSVSFLPTMGFAGDFSYTTENIVMKKEKSPYLIFNQLYIDYPGNLTIEPGVVVKFYSPDYFINSAIMTNGKVEIGKTGEDRVIFTDLSDKNIGTELVNDYDSSGQSSGGLIVFDGSLGVFVNNIDLKNTREGIQSFLGDVFIDGLDLYGDESIMVFGGNFYIKNSKIHDVFNDHGVFAFEGSSLYADNISISDIIGEDFSSSMGIGIFDADFNIRNSTIKNINDGNGISLFDGAKSNINNVRIEDFYKYGIFLDKGVSLTGDTVSILGGKVGLFGRGSVQLKNLSVRDSEEGVFRSGGDLLLENSIIENNDIGIRIVGDDGESKIFNSSIFDNFSYGMLGESEKRIIDARGNWWGSDTGPLSLVDDEEDFQEVFYCVNEEAGEEYECEGTEEQRWKNIPNPDGLGDEVLGRVDFSNWLVSEPIR